MPVQIQTLILVTGLMVVTAGGVLAQKNVQTKLLSQAAFRAEMEQPLTARFDETQLGEILNELTQRKGVNFLIDRRVDPHRLVSWQTNGEPFLEAVADRLEANGLTARAVGSTVLVGPTDSLKRLRTLIHLRQEELQAFGESAVRKRFELLKPASPQWPEATEPRELLIELARRWNLTIEGLEEVPYDLWPAGRMHDVTAVEAISLVLIQFNLTFEWQADPSRLHLVSAPEKVHVERKHLVKVGPEGKLLDELKEVMKSIDHTLEKNRMTVRASIEEQERIADVLGNRGRKKAPVVVTNVPLKFRQFTLTAENVRVRDALKALEEQGVKIVFDQAAFEAAKIDLDHRVNLNLDKASANLFAATLCEPLGLAWSIDGVTLTLTVKDKASKPAP